MKLGQESFSEVLADVKPSQNEDGFVAPVRAYEITVQGFPPILYSARSPGRARTRAWHDFQGCYDCSFMKFLRTSKCCRAPWADGQHQRVLVNGKPATLVIHPHRRDQFMYDDSDVVMCAHHTEIVLMTAAGAMKPRVEAEGLARQEPPRTFLESISPRGSEG